MLKIMRLPTRLLRRKADSHKGDFGHILILAGSRRFSGAAVLSALAAMRAGAGRVTLGIPKSLSTAIIRIKSKEVMILPLAETSQGSLSLSAYKEIKDFLKKVDVLVIGPGLTDNKSTQELVRKVIKNIDLIKVIDADGLNALAGNLKLLRNKNIVMTPHPGEMARLLGKSIAVINKDRINLAKKFAKVP